MQLLEEYQQLIERDAVEISCLWKYTQIFLYSLCTISGYICSILFYTIWQRSFGGDCLLWANFILLPEINESNNDMYEIKTDYVHWWKYVVINSELMHKCNIYLITCFSSCIFGIIWFIFFLMCGKGGYDVTIYDSSWRIVLPATLFNFIFATVSIFANYNFQEGFKEFNKNIQNVFYEVYNSSVVSKDISDCEIIQTYIEIYHFHDYNVCNMLIWQQIFSNIMMWSWIGGSILLLLRIISVTDFTILKVTIYELPLANILEGADKNEIKKSNAVGNKKKE